MSTNPKSQFPEPLIPPVIKHRSCLRCHTLFSSQGPWNRICQNCAEEIVEKRYSKLETNYHEAPRRKGKPNHGN